MKRDLEMTVNFAEDETESLKSVTCMDHAVWIELWISEGRAENRSLTWDEWDALVAEVSKYRALKAQSEAA